MIMDKKEELPDTDSLLDKLTIRIASEINDEYKRKLSMQQPSSIENNFIREPSLDIDRELIELESLIKNLQSEIVEMTKNANRPQSEYKPNNDIAETKVNQNIFDSLPPISANDIEATFKSLWNSSNPDTTNQPDTADVTISDELKNELRKEIFGDPDFMNSLQDMKQNNEQEQSETDKNIPKQIEVNIDDPKNKNIKTGLIMRIFGPNDNTISTDKLNSSISQKIFDIFKRNKSQSPIIDGNNEAEAINTSSLATDKNMLSERYGVEHNLSLNLTDVSSANDIVPKSQPNTASENIPNPPKNTSEVLKKTPSIKNLLSKIEQGFVSTIIGTNNKSSNAPQLKTNNIEDKTDLNKDSDSKAKIAHKVNVINIYIDTPKPDNYESPLEQNMTSVTKIHKGHKGRTASTSMNSKNVSITQLKQTNGTDSVFNDNAQQNTEHSCQKNKETADTIKKGNSKSASLFNTNNINSNRDSDIKLLDSDNNSTEFIKTGIYQPNKRTMSDPSVLKSRDKFDRPFESMNNELPKDCEMQANKNLILKKISNTRKSEENNAGHDVHDCHNCTTNDSFDDCLYGAPDHISNNSNSSPIEKPIIVIQFSEQQNVLEKEIVITKPIPSESNTFKVYTRSHEDLVANKTDLCGNIAGEVETAPNIVDIKSIDEKKSDIVEKSITDNEIRSVSKIVPKSHPIYINSTLITINNIDSNSDEFEDSQDFIEESAAMENPKKLKNE